MIDIGSRIRSALLAATLFAAACATGKEAAKPADQPPPSGEQVKPVSQEPTPEERQAQYKGAAPEKVTSVEGITEYRLANGLRVLLFPDSTKQTITVNITYLVGSRHEGYGETGMAHLLEHLVFKGTDRHANIPQELTAHGARPNGTTSFDRTNYYETFNASDENLNWALDLEADRMVNSHIAKKDLDSEMTVVRNEYEMGENSPGSVLFKRILGVMFDWHNYGHSTIGARSDIENVPIERLQAFYRRFYQPDNAVLTVAGKIDEAKTLLLVSKYFAAISKPERKLIPTYTREPTQDGPRSVTLERVGDTQLVISSYHVPSGVHPDSAAVEVLAFVLGDTPAGRLHKALVETGKASSVFGFFWSLAEPGMFFSGAELRKEQSMAEARKVMLSTVDALASSKATPEEVERARTNILKRITLTMNQADLLGLNLSEFIAKGDWRLFFLHRDRIRQVTADDVNRAAAAYLKPVNRTVGEFLPAAKNPERAAIPEAPKPEELLKGYAGDKAVEQGEAFDPSPRNIDSRTRRIELRGLKVALLPKKTRGGTVDVALNLRYGDLKSLWGKSAIADLSVDMLMRGTTKHTRQQIADEFDRLKARVSIGTQLGVLTARVETVRENLQPAMKLLAEVLREPTFPPAELEQLRSENLANIDESRREPRAMAGRAFERHLRSFPQGDPRHVDDPDESTAEYKAATLAQVKAFHQEFLGASVGELAVVGDFDDKWMGPLIGDLFAGWESRHRYERIPMPFTDVPPVKETLEAPDKANAVLLAGENLKLRDDYPEYPALSLGNYMLGGGFLNSRLAVRIRQKEGLSYGVGSSLTAGSIDESGSFSVSAIHAPQNTQKLEQAVREEVQRALAEGFTADEIAQAKQGLLQQRQVGRAQDGPLSGHLARWLYLGRTMEWDAELDAKLKALTGDQITAAMRKFIDVSKLTVVRAGEFEKK